MPRFVAYLVIPAPGQTPEERYEIIDMRGRVLKDSKDVMRWLAREAPLRPDLKGRRIDVVDLDEKA